MLAAIFPAVERHRTEKLINDLMAMDFSLGAFLLNYALKKSLDEGVKFIVAAKSGTRRTGGMNLTNLYAVARIDKWLLRRRRDKQRDRLQKFYSGEACLALGTSIRIAYQEVDVLFDAPELPAPSELITRQTKDFDIDTALGLPGFKAAAEQYRVDEKKHRPSFPGSAVRISEYREGVMTLSKADYIDQWVSNQLEIVDDNIDQIVKGKSVDIPSSMYGKTLRELELTKEQALPTFSRSKLANTIGIASLVFTKDGFLVIPRRNRKVAVDKGFEGCSVSGVMKWTVGLQSDFFKEVEHQLVAGEGAEEVGLRRVVKYQPLSLCREYSRAGKPQVFSLIFTEYNIDDLKNKWSRLRSAKDENSVIHWLRVWNPSDLSQEPDHAAKIVTTNLITMIADDSQIRLGRGTSVALSEETRACMLYAASFFEIYKSQSFPTDWLE